MSGICKETLEKYRLHDVQMAREQADRLAATRLAQEQLRMEQEQTAQRVNAPAPRASLSRHYQEVAGLTDGFDVARTDPAARARLLGASPVLSVQELQSSAAQRIQSPA